MSNLIRRAQPDEAAILSELALRSKAYWGYDEAFIQACKTELTYTSAMLETYPTFVSVAGDTVTGFGMLIPLGEHKIDLEALFIEPTAIGQGHGRKLWETLIKHAREQGYRIMTIQADPYAAPFYRRMGAQETGTRPSGSIPGRVLPLFEYELT